MFDFFQSARCLAVLTTHAGEVQRLLTNLRTRYGITLTVDELLTLDWQTHLRTLIIRLRDHTGAKFDEALHRERGNIILSIRLIAECEFADFSRPAVLECLRECGLQGDSYDDLVTAGLA